MLTKREAMFIVTTGNPVKLGRFAPRMAIRTSMVIFIGQAFFCDNPLILAIPSRNPGIKNQQ